MSDALPPFLAALGIADPQGVDERALRRAYARHLKQIDIEADPRGFQALRETLDHALRWLAMREQVRQAQAAALPDIAPAQPVEPTAEPAAPLAAPTPMPPAAPALARGTPPEAAPAPAPTLPRAQAPAVADAAPAPSPVRPLPRRPMPPTETPSPSAPGPGTAPLGRPAQAATPPAPAAAPRVVPPARPRPPAPPTAEQIAGTIFASFQQRLAAGFEDDEAARRVLVRTLSDTGLLNIDARTAFEASVARLLAGGWKTGHDRLLDPAIEVFGWNSDHARLKHFGQVGAFLTAAIRERVVVQALTPGQQATLAQLLARIRAAAPPDPAQLKDEVGQLQFLVQRVPSWLRIVSPVDPVNQRFDLWKRQPQSVPPTPTPAPAPAPRPMATMQPTPQFVGRKPASATMPGALVLAALVVLGGIGKMASMSPSTSVASPAAHPARVQPDAAADADLARRQQEADEMLARILRATPAADAGR